MYHTIKEASAAYYRLDPATFAPKDTLLEMHDRAKSAGGPVAARLAAALVLELSRHPEVYPEDRYDYVREAQRRYEYRKPSGEYRLQHFNDDMVRAHMPLFVNDNTAAARSAAVHDTADLLRDRRRQWAVKDPTVRHGDLGYDYEIGACLLTNALQPSLVAYPSLPRQDNNLREVDGHKYRWDVTIESNGSVIEKGQYRVQVKSSLNESNDNYHADIHILRLGRILPQRSDIHLLPELLEGEDACYGQILNGASSYILDQLAKKPPASEAMHYVRR
ncbi:MAG TPA: hypothetical protein VK978_01465 [Candidatus Saccharimonadales bacterium]|nr:hypothetical protein [Candidatus Saccharimonadales bacterium]